MQLRTRGFWGEEEEEKRLATDISSGSIFKKKKKGGPSKFTVKYAFRKMKVIVTSCSLIVRVTSDDACKLPSLERGM